MESGRLAGGVACECLEFTGQCARSILGSGAVCPGERRSSACLPRRSFVSQPLWCPLGLGERSRNSKGRKRDRGSIPDSSCSGTGAGGQSEQRFGSPVMSLCSWQACATRELITVTYLPGLQGSSEVLLYPVGAISFRPGGAGEGAWVESRAASDGNGQGWGWGGAEPDRRGRGRGVELGL